MQLWQTLQQPYWRHLCLCSLFMPHIYVCVPFKQWFSNFSVRWPPIKVYNFLLTPWPSPTVTKTSKQARSQVLTFGGAKHIFRGVRLLFLLYFWNKFFWQQENLWGNKINLGSLPPNAPPWLRACKESVCQNKFQCFLLEMHAKIHNPKICLELRGNSVTPIRPRDYLSTPWIVHLTPVGRYRPLWEPLL